MAQVIKTVTLTNGKNEVIVNVGSEAEKTWRAAGYSEPKARATQTTNPAPKKQPEANGDVSQPVSGDATPPADTGDGESAPAAPPATDPDGREEAPDAKSGPSKSEMVAFIEAAGEKVHPTLGIKKIEALYRKHGGK